MYYYVTAYYYCQPLNKDTTTDKPSNSFSQKNNRDNPFRINSYSSFYEDWIFNYEH